MRIHPPELNTRGGVARIFSRIELEINPVDLPAEIWFEFDPEYVDWLHPGMEPFALYLLYTAMALRENRVVSGHLRPHDDDPGDPGEARGV